MNDRQSIFHFHESQATSASASKLESSKAVSHLPISSQLEYHRLLNRMKLLEKQKEQKSRLKNEQSSLGQAVPATIENDFENITVVIQNENRTIQTNKPMPTDDTEKNPSNLLKSIKTPLTASNTSLAKKVLVKNAIDSLTAPSAPNTVKLPSAAAQSKKNEPAKASDGKESVAKSKPTAMSLAMFEKKAPKERAIVLANYVKRYHAQGFVCDCILVTHKKNYA